MHHAAVAATAGHNDVTITAALDDWRSAPIDERLRATLGFLEKLTLTPAEVRPVDIEVLHAAGVNDQAIEEAIYVCFLFNLIDRLADTFDFQVPSAAGVKWVTRFLLKAGYGRSGLRG